MIEPLKRVNLREKLLHITFYLLVVWCTTQLIVVGTTIGLLALCGLAGVSWYYIDKREPSF